MRAAISRPLDPIERGTRHGLSVPPTVMHPSYPV